MWQMLSAVHGHAHVHSCIHVMHMCMARFLMACVQELLRPFLQACEFKNGKLVTVAFSSFQKFVQNKAIGPEGRSQIIKALTAVGCSEAA